MIVCILVGCAALLCSFRMRGKEDVRKKMLLCVGVFALLGAVAEYGLGQERELQADGSIRRNEAGEGGRTAELLLEVPELDTEYEMTVEIPERSLSEEECRELLEEAKQEIDETFCGINPSLNEITDDIVVQDSYQEGLVKAEWSFDNYELVEPDGMLKKEKLTEEGTLVYAVCEMTCGACRSSYEFAFRAVRGEQSTGERLRKAVEEVLQKQGERVDTTEFLLPEEIQGYALSWRETQSSRAYGFLVLGILLAVGVRISELEKEKRTKKEREMLLTLEYPEIVNKLSLLLGAGMTLGHAWKKVAASYEKERNKTGFQVKPAYEEMLITCREMESGTGERNAYEHFGERCGIRRYRKLASLLEQNAKKGTRGLSLLLEQESEDAFEERKNMAKKYAEEAGTKLLLPMMLMLGIVIAIIMVPAVLSFQM